MSTQQRELIWLKTSAISGFGYKLAMQALSCSNKVIATGRAQSIAKLDNLKAKGAEILKLDAAVAIHGRVDVLVNNVGYVHSRIIEEANTNLFRALNVTRVFLPYMQEQRAGTIVWMGSIARRTGFPCSKIYGAMKWALQGVSLALHNEILPIGLCSICIDFGFFCTSLLEAEHFITKVSTIPDYKEIAKSMDAHLKAYNQKQPGNPVKGMQIILNVVHGEGSMKDKPFPPALVLGTDCYNMALEESLSNSKLLDEWKGLSCSTDFSNLWMRGVIQRRPPVKLNQN
ncbi:hypothetical protein CPB84DRAFT_1817305 [Gymnopilus junonius]|uniref:Uncharacterized protein n=1 Tax=Gymnopilus junonius TaxID=109634 RepID=A0A9P5ND86_GYMJU|nr:hypothetical protein CPB84DRAFT_1817305 [Gymnopilus junonius]